MIGHTYIESLACMTSGVPGRYQLLVGSNRVALWATLSLFKRRCVQNLVSAFFEELREELSQSPTEESALANFHVEAIKNVRTSFRSMKDAFVYRRTQYETLLAQSLIELINEAEIGYGKLLRDTNPEHLAATRVNELMNYLALTYDLWSAVELSCTPSSKKLTGA